LSANSLEAALKTIGLIGGMSWESTVTYYQLLNRMARERLGGLHSAKVLLWSFDFAEIEACQAAGDWEAATTHMIAAAQNLQRGGAQCIVICTNTMHKMAAEVQEAVDIPLLHIADAAATAIHSARSVNPFLLGTRFTMEQDFYAGYLSAEHGITVRVPGAAQRTIVHDVIYDELCHGIVKPDSKQRYLDIIDEAVKDGADSVIFGCTEIGLLISAGDLAVPGLDTTALHASAALDFALDE
jgi:aspartate racemase